MTHREVSRCGRPGASARARRAGRAGAERGPPAHTPVGPGRGLQGRTRSEPAPVGPPLGRRPVVRRALGSAGRGVPAGMCGRGDPGRVAGRCGGRGCGSRERPGSCAGVGGPCVGATRGSAATEAVVHAPRGGREEREGQQAGGAEHARHGNGPRASAPPPSSMVRRVHETTLVGGRLGRTAGTARTTVAAVRKSAGGGTSTGPAGRRGAAGRAPGRVRGAGGHGGGIRGRRRGTGGEVSDWWTPVPRIPVAVRRACPRRGADAPRAGPADGAPDPDAGR